MDVQKKKLVTIVLTMIKEVYQKTSQLEEVLQTGSVQILSRNFDPMEEMLGALDFPEEQANMVYEFIQLYLDDQMTVDEVVLGIENGFKEEALQS
ncbi:hypothetical protein GXN76_12680 [Kroppenstedtia pulmonis]|uniref:Uncharacterized protein n=1 Tax=Kroppenstedtia pulmonis TaxID=1380685 RepID=A0A7D3Y603_9BACL|nr:hypothetical protein [Kroppenstedtia pulmonis]QKG85245.1 hypothetical protein GXN76_12680 [Kroppenstedtia pulmonis]